MPSLGRGVIPLVVLCLVLADGAEGQSISNRPGVVLGATVGRTAYRDDSGSTARREFRVRGGYRLCVACAGFGKRIRLLPFVSLAFTDLAGLSHAGDGKAAVSALDAGIAGVFDLTRAWRLEVMGAAGLTSTAERLTTRPGGASGRDFVNLSGSGAGRWGVQLERACLPLPILGRRSLVAGVSSARGRYDSYEMAGDTRALPTPTRHRSTSLWVGVQSRMLLADCGG
ncbi:MAG TPA: hypothetical protein VEA99_07205 [Gemmatimonadaceae bacterium]|nr:hypothetical protein [Gemmatimonadaceae bacterium]